MKPKNSLWQRSELGRIEAVAQMITGKELAKDDLITIRQLIIKLSKETNEKP